LRPSLPSEKRRRKKKPELTSRPSGGSEKYTFGINRCMRAGKSLRILNVNGITFEPTPAHIVGPKTKFIKTKYVELLSQNKKEKKEK
jgi:hypothetical protein